MLALSRTNYLSSQFIVFLKKQYFTTGSKVELCKEKDFATFVKWKNLVPQNHISRLEHINPCVECYINLLGSYFSLFYIACWFWCYSGQPQLWPDGLHCTSNSTVSFSECLIFYRWGKFASIKIILTVPAEVMGASLL